MPSFKNVLDLLPKKPMIKRYILLNPTKILGLKVLFVSILLVTQWLLTYEQQSEQNDSFLAFFQYFFNFFYPVYSEILINNSHQRIWMYSINCSSFIVGSWEQFLLESDPIRVVNKNQGFEPGTCGRLVGVAVALEDLISSFEGFRGLYDHILVVARGWIDGFSVAVGMVIGELSTVSEVEKELAFLHKQSTTESVLQFLVTHRFHLFPAERQVRPHNMTDHRKWIFYLKNPEYSISRDILESEDSLSFNLTVPYLKVENEWHQNY